MSNDHEQRRREAECSYEERLRAVNRRVSMGGPLSPVIYTHIGGLPYVVCGGEGWSKPLSPGGG